MHRLSTLLTTCGMGLVLISSATAQSTHRSDLHDFNAVPFISGLEHMWSMAFLPDGDMLVTERPGRLRLVRNGVLLEDPVPGTPEVFARGQGGLLDIALHPDFSTNRLIYLSYSKPVGANSTTAVARARFENDALLDLEDIFVADSRGRGHYGSRLAFDDEGYLFITVGDRQASPSGDLEAHPAQDLSNHHGTLNRLRDDGSIPVDNPFSGQPEAQASIWSYGHRNQQGMAISPVTGEIWAIEHGPQGGDELNLIKRGANYGWPVIGYGVNYGGSKLHDSTHMNGMEQPSHYWVPSIATSGLMLYTGSKFPMWQGNLFVGGLVGQQVARLTLRGQEIVGEETLFSDMGRIRDIRQGPDGYIYLGIDANADDVSIVRLEPVGENR